MKNRLIFPLLIGLLVSLLFSLNAFSEGTVVRVAPHPLNSIWVDPDTETQLKPITVDIVIENGQNVAGYQVMLQFNGDLLEYDGIQHGNYLPKGAFFGKPQIDTDPNDSSLKTILFAATSFSSESSGYGVLATLTFEPITSKSSALVLLDETVLSNKEQRLLYPILENSSTYTVRFERNELVVESVQAIPIGANEAQYSYSKGDEFQLRATVRNKGNAQSDATKLILFYGPSPTDPEKDIKLGESTIGQLDPHDVVEVSLPAIVAAPTDLGIYDYTVCIGKGSAKCSKIEIKVEELPDLVVESVTANKTTLGPGETFILTATLKNDGVGRADAPIYYRWHRSTHREFHNMDVPIRVLAGASEEIGEKRTAVTVVKLSSGPEQYKDVALTANQFSKQSIYLTAPEDPGTYYYHVCVESPLPESNPHNNCSNDVEITVGVPDLVVESFGASLTGNKENSTTDLIISPEEEFYLHVGFKNKGTPTSKETRALYYRSVNDTISETDTLIGTGKWVSLHDNNVVKRKRPVTAPATSGTYYYGVCVDSVTNGIDTKNNCSGAVKVTVDDASNPNDVPLELPKDLISEVAFGPNSTYFVLNPQFAKVPEKDKNENYFFYKSTITLGLGSRFITDDSIQHADQLPDELPYLMMPFGETPGAIAETANEIAAGSTEKALKNTAQDLIRGGTLTIAGRFPIIGAFVGPISLLKDLILGFIDSTRDSDAIVAAMREELRKALTHPKMTIWNYSSFFQVQENPFQENSVENVEKSIELLTEGMHSFQENSVENVDRPILFMIPERLTSIEVEIEQNFYHKNDRIPIQIVGELKPNSKDFWIWTLTLKPNPSETFSAPISLPSNGYYFRNSPSLQNLLDKAFEDIDLYITGNRAIEPLGFLNGNEDARTDEELNNEYVVGKYIRDSLEYVLGKALESAPELGNLSVWELESILYPMGVIRDLNRITCTIYTGRLRRTKHHNIWNLEETWQQQENNTPAAPRARPTSLADYPPFQQLSPEIQEYLLQHFEGAANTEVTNVAAWQIPEKTSLLPNYPNPFNPETWIPYQLTKPAAVTLTIYDINGRVVRDLDLGHQRAGVYRSRARAAHWDGRNAHGEPVASGLYFYTLKAGDFTATRKMLIRK